MAWVAETVVGDAITMLLPYTRRELALKPLPIMVSVMEPLPATTDVGEMLEICGAGLGATITVNVCGLDVPPPGVGFTTVIA